MIPTWKVPLLPQYEDCRSTHLSGLAPQPSDRQRGILSFVDELANAQPLTGDQAWTGLPNQKPNDSAIEAATGEHGEERAVLRTGRVATIAEAWENGV